MTAQLALLALVIILACFFDYTNGFHDTANAIATSVSTRALSPHAAVLISALFNLAGAFINTRVANTIGGLVTLQVGLLAILCALVGAIGWNLLTWYYGLPSSSSHALVGGVVGGTLVSHGAASVKWNTVEQTMASLVVSPMLGLVLGFLIMLSLLWIFRRAAPRPVNHAFRWLQVITASFTAFSHGSNDAQKTMGVMTLALVSAGVLDHFEVPDPVIVISATAMALGTYSGGWRIVRTMGTRIIKLDPVHGVAAETTAATLIQVGTQLGLPVSTTHVVSAAIMGVGSTRGLSGVRWGVATNILLAWLITIPASAGLAALTYLVAHNLAALVR